MKIDAHQHFWVYDTQRCDWITDDMQRIQRDFLPDDLAPVLKTAGIDACIAVQADSSEAETLFLLALAERYESFVKGVVGWVDLQAHNLPDRLDMWSQYEALKGFRHIVQAESDDFMTRPAFMKGVEQLAVFGFTYDILIFPSQFKAALHLVRQVPAVKYVIDHIAKPYIKDKKISTWSNYMRELAKQPQVFCKISGMVTEAHWAAWSEADFYPYLDVVFEAFGPDRLMFGSDWPVCLVAAEYSQVVDLLQNYMTKVGFSVTEQNKVMGQTAAQFYGISGMTSYE